MKILHLAAGKLTGGAAKGTLNLHKGLIKLGVESRVLTNGQCINDAYVTSLHNDVFTHYKLKMYSLFDKCRLLKYNNKNNKIFSLGYSGIDIKQNKLYQEADIVHLHWINGLISLKTISNINKPIVWTLRDMWPFTGGCHYSLNCSKYKSGCGLCPQLGSINTNDLSKKIVDKKLICYPDNLTIVGVSKWISECARSSVILKNHPIHTISNSIDTSIFIPMDKEKHKEMLGIDSDKKIILIGSQRLSDTYKGLDYFVRSMNCMEKSNLHLVTFGSGVDEKIRSLKIEQTHLGFISDEKVMASIYSIADVYVFPSVMEAFGKTVAEAQSCETPVVCFDAAGPRDIVEHQVTGYKAAPFDIQDLANGIDWILSLQKYQYEQICLQSRQRTVKLFDSIKIANKYVNLYRELVN